MKTLLFILVFIQLEAVVASLLEPPQRLYKDYDPRLRWVEFYGTQQNIDLLFLGSSHAYRSFDPRTFDSELSLNSFNLGNSNQNPIDSYFVLKEALRVSKPRMVVLEVFWVLFETNDNKERDFESACLVLDNIGPSLNKLSLIGNCFTLEQMPKAIFLSIRYHNNIMKPSILKENFEGRWLGTHPLGDKTFAENQSYEGKGYVATNRVATNTDLKEENYFLTYSEPKWSSARFRSFEKCLELCQESGIKVIMVTAPLPPDTMGLIKDYENIHNKFNQLAIKYNVKYVDYNEINKTLNLFNNNYFSDEHHLNSQGVQIMNRHLIRIIDSELNDN
ncbi:MAG: hypothetical protein ABFC94_09180 [Syntrophomonas sp.]